MSHKIAEAIIENGKIKYIDRKLPEGRIKVHLIYDAVEEALPEEYAKRIVEETSGLYKNIDAEAESRKLRAEWERNVED